jgi:viroplasmin and RNaseH domain-containing protein
VTFKIQNKKSRTYVQAQNNSEFLVQIMLIPDRYEQVQIHIGIIIYSNHRTILRRIVPANRNNPSDLIN